MDYTIEYIEWNAVSMNDKKYTLNVLNVGFTPIENVDECIVNIDMSEYIDNVVVDSINMNTTRINGTKRTLVFKPISKTEILAKSLLSMKTCRSNLIYTGTITF